MNRYSIITFMLVSLLGSYGCSDDTSANAPSGGAGGSAGSSIGGASGGSAAGQGGAGQGGAGQAGTGQGGSAGIQDAPSSPHTYAQDDTNFMNPERGFYMPIELLKESELSWVRDKGFSLAYSYIRLDDYRQAPIDKSLLDKMDASLDVVRSSGLKIILRFAYNFGPYPNSEPDASKSWILKHIAQLKPYLTKHKDVILLVQAGFIGAWGEWHTSTNHLLDDPKDRREILEALLGALPADRMTQIRYPGYKLEMYGDALDAAHAFDGSNAARVGHHNDCFLADDTDEGTYDNRAGVPPKSVDEWKAYVAADTNYVPMGGETCAVSSRSTCPTALKEMKMLHFSFINDGYHPDVVASWAPCRPEMERKLGYRFQVKSASYPENVRPGGTFHVRLDIANQGWARLFNPRPLVVVLRGATNYAATVSEEDIRRWGPGETSHVDIHVGLPAKIAPGSYQLAIRMPDGATSLASRPAYAVRMAGTTWHKPTGDNDLGTVAVTDDAPGAAVAGAKEFRVIGGEKR